MPKKGLTKENITMAAAELLEEYGYENLSMRSLAARLGIKAASLYNYFKNQEELMTSVNGFVLGRINEALKSCDGEKEPSRRLFQIGITYREFAQRHPDWYRVFTQIPLSRNGNMLFEAKIVIHGMDSVLDEFKLSDEEKMHFYRAFWGAIHGFISAEKIGYFGGTVNMDESYQYMLRILIQSLEH